MEHSTCTSSVDERADLRDVADVEARSTVTGRAGMSTFSPCPDPRVRALAVDLDRRHRDGTCRMSPINAAQAADDRSVAADQRRRPLDSTSPSASSVIIACPSRIVAS